MTAARRTAFVLGGGGILGAVEVGMLQALAEAGVRPDLIVGTSVGALNGALLAADPSEGVIERLIALWESAAGSKEVYGDGAVRQVRRAVSTGTHLHSPLPLRQLVESELGDRTFDDLVIPFQCCAASIERAAEHWFTQGPVVDAVMASAAVPGLLPPAVVDGEHYLDGGIVNSIPVARAAASGAEVIFVLQVGRVDQPLSPPRKPWDVARVSFEIARRHRFHREMAELPDSVTAHVLPTGASGADPETATSSTGATAASSASSSSGGSGARLSSYRSFSAVLGRIEAARAASASYLSTALA